MWYSACGLDSEGLASCWGYNSRSHELGDPDNDASSSIPLPVSAPVAGEEPLEFSVLRHGMYHSCGLTTSSRLYCWGHNSSGQLGDGTYDDAPRPFEPLPGRNVQTFGTGASHTCAVTADGVTYCWGENYNHTVIEDDNEEHTIPTERFDADTFIPVGFAMGNTHSCAWNAAGVAWCWGDNSSGHLGRPAGSAGGPAEVAGGLRFKKLDSQREHVCGLADDELLYCWGSNLSRIPHPDHTPEADFQPRRVPGQ